MGLLLAGALAGLGLAGYSLLTATDTAPKVVPLGAVALVNGRQVLKRDFEAQAETQYGKPFKDIGAEDRKGVLESMIREELLVQRGLEIEVPKTDPDVRQAIVNAVNLVTAAEVEATQPSEAELRASFEKNREDYVIFGTYRLRDLVLPLGSNTASGTLESVAREAAAAIRRDNAPAAIDGVAARYGLKDSSRFGRRDAQGAFAEAELSEPSAERALGAALYAAASRLKEGEVSDPLAAPDGLHILVLRGHRPKSYLTFEQARGRVDHEIRRQALEKAEEAQLSDLRRKAVILVARDYQK